MPKRKKQNQQQQQLQQQPPLPERDETGDEEDGSPIGEEPWRGPPSLLGPPPMANGKPGDPKSAFHRGPPGSRGPVIPPLLSLPPPPRGRGPVQGGLGPRQIWPPRLPTLRQKGPLSIRGPLCLLPPRCQRPSAVRLSSPPRLEGAPDLAATFFPVAL
ncbi:proline-rich protein 3 isoform X4 [Muntiacus reevesi]|uniref:proline-rich protein 3 isoform X4 n=1 Tax=Muntiacus reevesi TaxID=9886 RepID=UPI003307B319